MSTAHDSFLSDGCVVLPGLYTPAETERLRALSEHVLAQWLERDPLTGAPGNPDATVLRHLNHPAYFRSDRSALAELLTLTAAPQVLAQARELLQEEPLFRCTSLFFEPRTIHADGNWHRDTQFLYPDETEERHQILKRDGVSDHIQLQVALVPSDDIEYVPGSHRRWDTPEEHRIRRSENRSNAMPDALRVALMPGDAVAFNAHGLHRGRYHRDRLRRTFMVTFTRTSTPLSDHFSHQPWCLEPGYLEGVPTDAKTFFSAFCACYRAGWRPSLTP